MLGTVKKLASYPLYAGGRVERHVPAAHIAWDNGQQEVREVEDIAEILTVGARVSGVPHIYKLELVCPPSA